MEAPPAAPPRAPGAANLSVALELGRALGGVALLPARLLDFYLCREALATELEDDLEATPPAPWTPAQRPRLGDRPLRVFVSAAETSGEIHAAGLARALTERALECGAPPPQLTGLGGERLRAAGVHTIADPVARATMGLAGALRGLPYYLGLLRKVAAHLSQVDVAVLVDSPALHVPIGRMARRAGARAVHFVTPQYWGWAPWRARGYRSAVDRALTILPFEPRWFARRGVQAVHVGHPLLDALPARTERSTAGRPPTLVLLPGSRDSVVDINLPWMLRVLERLDARVPGLEVVLPPADARLAERICALLARAGAAQRVRVAEGELHSVLARADAALSVSGTVLIDLLHQRVPTVVVYRVRGPLPLGMYRSLVTAPWFASTNLLAAEEVLPEHAFSGEGDPSGVAAELERALCDPAWRRRCRIGMDRAAQRLGGPGALLRAADAILELAPHG